MKSMRAAPAGPAATAGPRWRPLAVVLTLVLLAHGWVLQDSPAQFGQFASGPDPDEAGGKTFATRSIDPPVAPVAAAIAPPAVPAPPAVKSAVSPAKTKPNKPLGDEIRARAAPESIAKTISPSVVLTSTPTAAIDVPSESAAALPASAPAASSPAAAATASLQAGAPNAVVTTQVSAVNLPGSARLQYSVVGLSKSLNYQATAELLWKASGDKYEAVLKVSAFLVGSRSLTSVGQITASGLAPTRFSDRARQELAAHFEPTKGKIVFSANTPDAPWVEGAQDRVSVLLQLGGILAAKPADYPAGASISLYTVGPREADTWTFVVEQPENLDLMGAPLATLKLTRKPRREFDQKVEVWLAPSLGYLPVRNRITQPSGDFVDQRLSEISKS